MMKTGGKSRIYPCTVYTLIIMLINRYRKRSVSVKLALFKTFYMSMYDLCLWKQYSVTDITRNSAIADKPARRLVVLSSK